MRRLDDAAEIAGVAARWRAAYHHPAQGGWGTCALGDTEAIYERLAALPSHATREDVAAIIGNNSWIGETCTECCARAVVLVGQEPDYESATVYLCAPCAHKLNQLAEADTQEPTP